jgi:hypothetical protein
MVGGGRWQGWGRETTRHLRVASRALDELLQQRTRLGLRFVAKREHGLGCSVCLAELTTPTLSLKTRHTFFIMPLVPTSSVARKHDSQSWQCHEKVLRD